MFGWSACRRSPRVGGGGGQVAAYRDSGGDKTRDTRQK